MPELSLSSVKSCSSLMTRRSLLLDMVFKRRRVYRGQDGWFQLEKKGDGAQLKRSVMLDNETLLELVEVGRESSLAVGSERSTSRRCEDAAADSRMCRSRKRQRGQQLLSSAWLRVRGGSGYRRQASSHCGTPLP
jgi:hypothetical protein